MGHHSANDSLTTIGADRLAESDLRHGRVILPTKGLNPKIGLQFLKVLAASLPALRIVPEVVGIDPELLGDKGKHVRGWGFLRAKHPSGKSQVSEMHRKAEAI
jgi:hypothetical protein